MFKAIWDSVRPRTFREWSPIIPVTLSYINKPPNHGYTVYYNTGLDSLGFVNIETMTCVWNSKIEHDSRNELPIAYTNGGYIEIIVKELRSVCKTPVEFNTAFLRWLAERSGPHGIDQYNEYIRQFDRKCDADRAAFTYAYYCSRLNR